MLKVIEMLQRDELFPRYKDLVFAKRRDDLLLLNYTPKCEYANAWDEVTSVCRGLIVDTRDWSIAARPFDKFFNVGAHALSVKRESLPDLPFTVFEKVDGTFGVMYRDRQGAPWLATRGGFESPQAIRGTEMLRRLRLDALPDGYTPLFEIVYPNQHTTGERFSFSVINYGFEGLVLLGLRHRVTGEELPWEETVELAGRLGARLPKVYAFASFDEAYANAKALPRDQEGFVLRFADGLRVKLKGSAYLALNALVWDISDTRILEALIGGGRDAYLQLVREVPEEVRAEADRFAAEYSEKAAALCLEAKELLREAPKADRKTFAAWVNANVRGPIRGALFHLYAGKDPNWYKLVRDLS